MMRNARIANESFMGRLWWMGATAELQDPNVEPERKREILREVLASFDGVELDPDSILARILANTRRAFEASQEIGDALEAIESRMPDCEARIERIHELSPRELAEFQRDVDRDNRILDRLRRRDRASRRPTFRTSTRGLRTRWIPSRSRTRAHRRVRTMTRRATTDSGGSEDSDGGDGHSHRGSCVRRCSLRLDQPQGPPGTGITLAAGYSAELRCVDQLKAGVVLGSREVGVKSRSDEGTRVPWSRRRQKQRPSAASSLLDTFGITRPPRQGCNRRHR